MNQGSATKEKVKRATESVAKKTVLPVLMALSFSHFLNDTFQSLIPAMYPVLKGSYQLNFSQIGFITFTFQVTGSIFQPLVGWYTDRNPKVYALSVGMCFTAAGLISFALANNFAMLLVSVGIIGIGSSIFHPESSRVAHFASGGRKGMAQSLFQVGGRVGASAGPLLAAFIILPLGQFNIIWFGAAALAGAIFLSVVGRWYGRNRPRHPSAKKGEDHSVSFSSFSIPRRKALIALTVLLILTLSKYAYLASMRNYLTFYLINTFGISAQASEIQLFLFMAAVAAGTYFGGPIGDRIGRKYVIWISILGVAPLTILFPYANLFWASVLSFFIGFILSSAFPAILVYAQDLMPTSVGMVSGLFYGFAFGIAGLGTVLLGKLADYTSIAFVFHLCSFFPLIGILAWFLPDLSGRGEK
jgi:FSR family fosmidomycin resistance protein-like MFS transporter